MKYVVHEWWLVFYESCYVDDESEISLHEESEDDEGTIDVEESYDNKVNTCLFII